MKIAIVGSRGITNADIGAILAQFGLHPTTVISGGARGVDTLAEAWATANGVPVEIYKPEYSKFGKYAPLKRDEEMARACDALLAIWDGSSRGTAYTMKYARKLGKHVYVSS